MKNVITKFFCPCGSPAIILLFAILFCATVVFCGCSQQSTSHTLPQISADVTSKEEMKLSDYFENFRMVKLSSDSVIGWIQRIRYENDRIYIADGNRMFVFSNAGELLHHFSKIGSGPGEYLSIDDFIVQGDSILVLCGNLRSLIIYNHAGEHIATHNCKSLARVVSPAVNNTLFLYLGYFNMPLVRHKLQRIQAGSEDSFYLPIDDHRANYLFIFGANYFSKHNESIYFFEPYNDTIYESINGGDMKQTYIVDYNGRNTPPAFFAHDFSDIREFNEAFDAKNYVRGVFDFMKFDRYLMFKNHFGKEEFLTVFDHKNNISRTFATIRDDVYFKDLTFPVEDFFYHLTDPRIIVSLDATKVEEWRKTHAPEKQFEEQISSTHWEDNPVLLIFDVKK